MYLENKRQRVYRVTSDDKRETSVAPYQRERKRVDAACLLGRGKSGDQLDGRPIRCFAEKLGRRSSFPVDYSSVTRPVRIRVKFWKRSCPTRNKSD